MRYRLLIAITLLILLIMTVFLTMGYSAIAAEAETETAEVSSVDLLDKAFPRVSQNIRQSVKQALPNTPIDSVRPTGLPGLFEVIAGKNIFYIDPSGRYLVFGEIYDLKTASNITAERFQSMNKTTGNIITTEQHRIPWEQLPMDAAVHYGEGELRLAIFSDLDCPYCRQLTMALRQTEGIAISEIMFPVPALHPQAKEKSAAVLCADDPAAALFDRLDRLLQRGGPTEQPADKPATRACLQAARAKVAGAMVFGQKHGIQATPTLVAPDGRIHAGFMSPDEIKSWLKERK